MTGGDRETQEDMTEEDKAEETEEKEKEKTFEVTDYLQNDRQKAQVVDLKDTGSVITD